ncbi:TetR-like C-terminal domain-containing protein [Streptomyces sp. AC512_CC834]|uniref:TetR-like C-terminal domain-containing protein n=1 Tax=Streptomyces sp. AC512_CC834 TaxID=2823691 RepID=UPI001C258D84|nr:TetR-like C-terminal domain-containing protein [Streptomyces sp. AC512_CC834]
MTATAVTAPTRVSPKRSKLRDVTVPPVPPTSTDTTDHHAESCRADTAKTTPTPSGVPTVRCAARRVAHADQFADRAGDSGRQRHAPGREELDRVAARTDVEPASQFDQHHVGPRRRQAFALLETAKERGQIRTGVDLGVVVDLIWGSCYIRLLLPHMTGTLTDPA